MDVVNMILKIIGDVGDRYQFSRNLLLLLFVFFIIQLIKQSSFFFVSCICFRYFSP